MKVRTKFLMFTILITLFLGMFVYNESFAAVPDYGEPGSYNTAFSIDLVCESLENYEVDMSGDYGYETRVYSENILNEDFYVKIASLVDMGETIETSSFGVLNYVGTEEIVGRHCYIYTADITDKKIFDNKIIEDLRYSEYNFKFYYEISLQEVVVNINDLDVDIDTENKEYTGEKIKTSIIIKDGDYILLEGTDYKVNYENNKYPGTASVTINGIDKYKGEINKTFSITTILEYSIVNGGLCIKGASYNYQVQEIYIPQEINGQTVTSIGGYAFANYYKNLKKVILPDTISSIGSSAFLDCSKLENINIPNGISTIKSNTFQNCTNLEKIIIPETVTKIEDSAFLGCQKLIIDLPKNINYIAANPYSALKTVNQMIVYANTYAETYAINNNINYKKKYDVIFYDYNNIALDKQTVLEGEGATAPENPTRAGHTFLKWDNLFDSVNDYLNITAIYEKNTYEIIFYDYYGNEIKKEYVKYEEDAIPPDMPNIDLLSFKKWDKDIKNVKSDLAVYPIYSKIYSVTFKDYNGTILKEEKIFEGESATAPENPFREGYIFVKWDKVFSHITEDIEIVAIYREEKKYTVTFKDYDGTILKEEKVKEGKNATAPENPFREGYVFKEWNIEYSNIISDLEVTAIYTKLYTVIFKDYNGTILKEEKVKEGESATAPVNPSRKGYTFSKWDADYSKIDNDLTVTAIYSKNDNTFELGRRRETTLSTTNSSYNDKYYKAYWDIEDNSIAKIKSSGKTSSIIGSYHNVVNSVTIEGIACGETYLYLKDEHGNILITSVISVISVIEDISEFTVSNITSPMYYTGEAIEPNIVLQSLKGNTLVKDIDYTVTYLNNIDDGYATIIIRGIDTYTGEITKNFEIQHKNINDLKVNIDTSDKEYEVNGVKLDISIVDGTYTLIENKDYTVAYENNIDIGTATITIRGIDVYKGEIIKTFKINTKDIFTLEHNISTMAQEYNGKELKSDIWFKHNDYKLVEGKDYTVSYSNNKYPGIATFTITGLGNYSGTTTKEFIINKGYIPIEYGYSDISCWYDGKKHTGFLEVTSPKNAIVKYMDANGNYTLDEMPQYIDVGVYKIKYRIFVNDYYIDAFGEQTLTINKWYINNYSSDYEGVYDGKEHSINVKVDAQNYDIKYSVDNQNYDLNSLPMFINPGEYTVNYNVTNKNYYDLVGSNKVRIYGIKSFDSTLELRNNILVIKNYKNIFDEVCKRIKIYAPSWGYAYYDVAGNRTYNAIQLVQTGGSIGIEINNRTEFKYKVAVLADVNGDGKISALDYVKIKNHIMKTNLINSDVYLTAADVNDDGKISALDYVRIKNYIMNGGV